MREKEGKRRVEGTESEKSVEEEEETTEEGKKEKRSKIRPREE